MRLHLLKALADHLEPDLSPYLPPNSRNHQSFYASWRVLCDMGLRAPVNYTLCTLCCAMNIMSSDLKFWEEMAAQAQSLAVFSWTLCPSWSREHFGSCFHEQRTSVLWDEPVVTEPYVVCLPCLPLAPLARSHGGNTAGNTLNSGPATEPSHSRPYSNYYSQACDYLSLNSKGAYHGLGGVRCYEITNRITSLYLGVNALEGIPPNH